MSSEPAGPFLVAAVQATPVFLDRAATVEKACALIAEAGRAGARLAVFPECFIPAYPLWAWFIPAGRTMELRELYTDLLENAISVPGEEVDRLCRAAADAGINVVMGINERNAEASGTTLYNGMLFIGSDGRLLGKHRKLVPTVAERLVHGQGDGSTLGVHDLDIGRLGGLICWENYMPLARYALYAWGVQIYVAPTWDRGEPWTSTLRHIAKEGRVYVIGACSPMRRDDIPESYAFKTYLPEVEWLNPGESMIIDPDGKFLVEPVANREEILYAEVNPRNMKGPRFQLDVAGHYGRPDLFELTVNRIARPMVRLNEVPNGYGFPSNAARNDDPFDEALEWLRSDDPMTYEGGYHALIDRVDECGDRLLRLMLEEKKPEMRAKFIELLGESDDPHMVGVIARELDHPEEIVRAWAVSALENIGSRGSTGAAEIARAFRIGR